MSTSCIFKVAYSVLISSGSMNHSGTWRNLPKKTIKTTVWVQRVTFVIFCYCCSLEPRENFLLILIVAYWLVSVQGSGCCLSQGQKQRESTDWWPGETSCKLNLYTKLTVLCWNHLAWWIVTINSIMSVHEIDNEWVPRILY